MSEQDLGEAWLAAWSGGERDAFAPLCSVDIHYQDPLTAEPLHGVSALGDHAALLWSGVPDARFEAAGPVPAQGSALALPWRLHGTQSEPLGDLPASGRRLRLHGIFYCRLDGGEATAAGDRRLLAVRAFFDLYDAGTQLGVLPARGTPGERALLMLQGFGLRAPEP